MTDTSESNLARMHQQGLLLCECVLSFLVRISLKLCLWLGATYRASALGGVDVSVAHKVLDHEAAAEGRGHGDRSVERVDLWREAREGKRLSATMAELCGGCACGERGTRGRPRGVEMRRA